MPPRDRHRSRAARRGLVACAVVAAGAAVAPVSARAADATSQMPLSSAISEQYHAAMDSAGAAVAQAQATVPAAPSAPPHTAVAAAAAPAAAAVADAVSPKTTQYHSDAVVSVNSPAPAASA